MLYGKVRVESAEPEQNQVESPEADGKVLLICKYGIEAM